MTVWKMFRLKILTKKICVTSRSEQQWGKLKNKVTLRIILLAILLKTGQLNTWNHANKNTNSEGKPLMIYANQFNKGYILITLF